MEVRSESCLLLETFLGLTSYVALAELQAVVRGLRALTGPLCQGSWVNTAADRKLLRSLARQKEVR